MTARIRCAGIALLALLLAGLAACGPVRPVAKPKPKPKATAGWVLYRNSQVGVTLRHPRGWRPVQGYLWRVGGQGGYVQLNTLNGAGWTAQQAAAHEASQQLHPFGTSPKITPISAAGESGYLIMPSKDADQPPGPLAAELVLPYPRPQTIDGAQYHFLIMDATASWIRQIAATLRFSQ